MIVKSFIYFAGFILLIFSNNLYGSYEAFDEDLELSRKIPLISGVKKEVIFEEKKAAITLCTIPLSNLIFSYDHVSLVFEIKHPVKEEINLFSVHFGGDGDSSSIEKGRPIIDGARDTLRKVFRGKKTTVFGIDYTDPLYSRKIVFVVGKDQAVEALKNVENDDGLTYSLPGWTYNVGGLGYKKCYNCCTYVNKVLKDAGIDTKFDGSWKPKSSSLLISYCESYEGNPKPITPKDYYSSLEIDEYEDSVKALFEKGLECKDAEKYDESMKHLLESAKKGHPIAQCFIGFCYYNKNEEKDEFLNDYLNFANKRQSLSSYKTDIVSSSSHKKNVFYDLLLKYKEFISSQYVMNSIKQNNHDSFTWIERSAKKEFPIAQGILGYFYMFSKEINIDKLQSISYTKRATKEDIVAFENLCKWYKEHKDRAEEEARKKTKFILEQCSSKHLNTPFNFQEYLNQKRTEEYEELFRIFGFSSDDDAQAYLSSCRQNLEKSGYL